MNAHSHTTPLGLPIDSTPESASPAHKHAENLIFDFLAIMSGLGLVLGVSDIFGAGRFSGLCLAIGAITFGLAFIVKALQKAAEAAYS